MLNMLGIIYYLPKDSDLPSAQLEDNASQPDRAFINLLFFISPMIRERCEEYAELSKLEQRTRLARLIVHARWREQRSMTRAEPSRRPPC
jgi:hypothetical protein